MRRRIGSGSVALLALLWLGGLAQAASRTIQAGQIVGISEDIVLSGDDVFEVLGTAERPCRLDANGQQIRTSGEWRGHVKIQHCELRAFGSAKLPAIDLTAAGSGEQIVIEHTAFLSSGAIHIVNEGQSATVFRGNTLAANSYLPVTNQPDSSPPVFRASGRSPAKKLFAGNFVAKSVVLFENAANWQIGGTKDDESNLLIGLRASLSIFRCDDMRVVGNYIHTEIPSFRWSQVHTLQTSGPSPRLIVEHNILRHGQWVVRGIEGEFRYNLVLDADGHNFIIGPRAGTHIHHNIFARYTTVDPNLNATIGVIYRGDDIQIFNNTFDGGGTGTARPWHVPAIEVGTEAHLASLRNNVFYNHPTRFSSGSATVRPGFTEKQTETGPPRLDYADYNLFYNPDARERRNYAVSVAGKTERTDAGFARHDVPAGGEKDAQVEPKFRGPVPRRFEVSDDDIAARKVTVRQILAAYRQAYSPADGSPLIGAGDPADGAGSFIGAVGPGDKAPADALGRLE